MGRLNETLTVFTDSPKYKQLPIRIYGEIVGNISMKPERVDFGFFNKESPPVKVIILTMEKPGDRFVIKGVEDATGVLGYDMVTIKEGSQYQLSVHILPGLNKNLINGNLFVSTDYPGEEKIKISVFGGVKTTAPAPKKPVA